MTALRVVLVDDEPLSRRALRQLLDARDDVSVVAECGDAASARAWLEDCDAVLLDIEMPGMSGLDLAREREAHPLPAIVFVTAFDEYAVPAFATEAVDYLCKPVTAARLDKALARIRAHVELHRAPPAPPTLGAPIPVRIGRHEELVPLDAVDCIEADGVYAALHTGGRRLLVRQSLAALEATLPSPAFLRVHRSWIVQRRAVKAVRGATDGSRVLVLHGGPPVPVSRRRVAAVLAWARGSA